MISVLALGRNSYAVSLNLCLTARALGASEITFIGKNDKKLSNYIKKVNEKWGGRFRVQFIKNYTEFLKSATKYAKIYLTQFGEPLRKKIYSLKTYKNMVLIVSPNTKSSKVQTLSDFNISVSAQPHCSAAAVAVFLHEFYNGRELAMHFENAKLKVVSSSKGIEIKKV